MAKYRVIVLREGATEDETLFELAGPAARVARIAPLAVADALNDELDADDDQQGDVADRVFDAAAAQLPANEQPAGPRRTRRTKAQIAADKLAAEQAAAGGVPPAAEPGKPFLPGDPSTSAPATAPVPAQPTGVPAAADGVPYNPFAPQ